MNILVTGGAGFIGGHLVDALAVNGHLAYVYDTARIEQHNVCGLYSFSDYLPDDRFDVVCHLAAATGVRRSLTAPHNYTETNVLGTLNVLDTCRERGIKKFIFFSSSSVYGDTSHRAGRPTKEDEAGIRPLSPYAATKVAGEALCHAYAHLYDMQITVLRPFTVYGPNCRPEMCVGAFVQAMLKGEPITVTGNGEQTRDFTYVDDVVDATIKAIETPHHEGRNYRVCNISGGRAYSISDLIGNLTRLVGKSPTINWVASEKADVPCTRADISNAVATLNWRPKVEFEEGLRRTVEWFREYQDAR